MFKIDLHIVAFDVPYPANYGGVIDVFYKLKSLSEQGVKISLHCFQYGREKSSELDAICQEVHYYRRKSIFSSLFSFQPSIVATRQSDKLLNRLMKNEAPILFEGLHSCYYLNHDKLKGRKKFVRAHNVEHHYYRSLAKQSTNLFKQIYYNWEASRLQKLERILHKANKLLAISKADQAYFKQYDKNVSYLPAFHASKVNEKLSYEHYALYYGNLEVEENKEAALFLMKVFEDLPYRLVIAGKNPSFSPTAGNKIHLIANPTDAQLDNWVKNAHVICLPTFQTTGIKLKLIKALIEGNEVIVNTQMIEGNELKPFCTIANSVEEWRTRITNAFSFTIQESEILTRRKEVASLFDNDKNAKRLVEWFAQAR